MDALYRACIFALCPLRIGTSRAHSSGFGDRIRQAVHEFSRGQLHATASAFALPRDRQESRFARLPHLFNDCLVIPFSRRFRAVRKHPEGSAPLVFAPPSSCGHRNVLRGYTAPHGLKGRNNRKERKSERDMDCGITTTILIVAPQISAQYQLYSISKKLATSARNLVLRR